MKASNGSFYCYNNYLDEMVLSFKRKYSRKQLGYYQQGLACTKMCLELMVIATLLKEHCNTIQMGKKCKGVEGL